MPKKPSRRERRKNTGLVIMSVLVIGSLALSAVISLVTPTEEIPTPTQAIFVTALPIVAPTASPELTPSPTAPSPAPPPVAPTP